MIEGGVNFGIISCPPKRYSVEGRATPDTPLRDITRFAQSVIATPRPSLGSTRPRINWQTRDRQEHAQDELHGDKLMFLSEDDFKMALGAFARIWREAGPSRTTEQTVVLLTSMDRTKGRILPSVNPLLVIERRYQESIELIHDGKFVSAGPLPRVFS
jgi:hypothetical protein